jgi:putative membrane protein
MQRTLVTVALLAMISACSPAADRDTAAADAENQVGAAGMDTAGTIGTTGVGTSGAMAGGSGETRAAAGIEGGTLDDASILARIAASDQMEVEEARLAQRHAQSAAVRELALTLERDHAASLSLVQAIQARTGGATDSAAGKEALRPFPEKNADLGTKSGAAFDQAFLERQFRLHAENIRSFEDQYRGAAQDAELRTLIQQTLPTLRQHLSMIERLQARQ